MRNLLHEVGVQGGRVPFLVSHHPNPCVCPHTPARSRGSKEGEHWQRPGSYGGKISSSAFINLALSCPRFHKPMILLETSR